MMRAPGAGGGPTAARRVGGVALAVLMVLVSAALGAVALNQTFEAMRLLAVMLVPLGSLTTAGWLRVVTAIPRVLLVVFLLGWLGAVMAWMHYYVRRAADISRLWALFSRTTLVELGILALATLIRLGLARLG